MRLNYKKYIKCALDKIKYVKILLSYKLEVGTADGNGRTSRLLMNLELLKVGYLPIIIENERRFEYYEILDIAAVEKNYNPFIQFVADYEKQELQRYLALVEENDNT